MPTVTPTSPIFKEAKAEYATVRRLHTFSVEARLALVRRLLASNGLL
jgi:hypothetical protein